MPPHAQVLSRVSLIAKPSNVPPPLPVSCPSPPRKTLLSHLDRLLPLTALLLGTAGTVAALTAGAAGIWAVHGPFYSWPSAFLDAQTASLGFALVKSLGALGGFCGPLVVGVLADAEGGDFAGGAFFLAAVALLGAGMTLGERGCRDCP